jgi:gamma-glutamylcyclotransferase (GGCT)/AIG2-like uncharacterized protein YtfP
MRKGNQKVFVYGTLKPRFHFGNLYLTQWSNYSAAIHGDLYMVNYGTYAGLKPNTSNVVEGNVYELDERMITVLDQVEGCPSLYKRIKIQTLIGEEVWTYQYTDQAEFNELNRIVHGKFEYVIGLYEKIVLLEAQNKDLVKVVLGGRALRIENPLKLGYKNDPLNVEHPCPTILAKYNGNNFRAKFLNGFDFYDHEKEGLDLMLPSGEIITGIPMNEIKLYDNAE